MSSITRALARAAARSSPAARRLDDGVLAHGCFVAPTVGAAPLDHPLWRDEHVPALRAGGRGRIRCDEAIARANASRLRADRRLLRRRATRLRGFLDRIEAGVTYVNRPQGATTGAWPGYQPFGGWKGRGRTGKAIGSFWYLPQYLREQSQTVVE